MRTLALPAVGPVFRTPSMKHRRLLTSAAMILYQVQTPNWNILQPERPQQRRPSLIGKTLGKGLSLADRNGDVLPQNGYTQ